MSELYCAWCGKPIGADLTRQKVGGETYRLHQSCWSEVVATEHGLEFFEEDAAERRRQYRERKQHGPRAMAWNVNGKYSAMPRHHRTGHVSYDLNALLLESEPLWESEDVGSILANIDREEAAKREYQITQAAWKLLGDEDRDILDLTEVQGLAYPEVARMKGLKPGAVKYRRKKALDNLRHWLGVLGHSHKETGRPGEPARKLRGA